MYNSHMISFRRNFQNRQNDVQLEYDDDFDSSKPSLPSSVSVIPKEMKSRESAIAEMKEAERSDNKTRNKRMFNLLLGTLQQFKCDEDGKNHSSQKRQREVDLKLEEAKRKEQRDLRQEKERMFQKRRLQEQEFKRLQRRKAVVAAAENQIGLLRKLQNFIHTTAKPSILYLPSKHTIRTMELQKKSHKRMEENIKRKQEELETELKIIDSQKLNVENGQEDVVDDTLHQKNDKDNGQDDIHDVNNDDVIMNEEIHVENNVDEVDGNTAKLFCKS